MSKTYSKTITNELADIGKELLIKWRATSKPLAPFAATCNLSVNSVKAIFRGATANIANYMTVMHELGTDLATITNLVDLNKTSPAEVAAPQGEDSKAIFS